MCEPQIVEVHRNECARALNDQGPQKIGVCTFDVNLAFSTCKVHENVKFSTCEVRENIFSTRTTQTQLFLENVDLFLEPNKSPGPFSGGVSDVDPDFFRCINVRKTGVCGP